MTSVLVVKGILGLFLLINTWQDWRRREILLWSVWSFGGLGLLLNMLSQEQSWSSILLGVVMGGIWLLFSLISRSSIGMGDGFILCVSGLYLGWRENLEMLVGALLLCAVFSAGLLLLKRAGRETRLPFVPFLFASYLWGVIL